MTEHPLPPPPAPRPRSIWRHPVTIAAYVGLALSWSALLLAVGSASATSTPPTTLATTASPPTTAAATPVAPTTSTAPPTTAPAPKGLRDGTFVVGTDIEPGTYRSTSTANCYWARLRNFSGTGNDVIANWFMTSGSVIVTIEATDVGFKSERCGPWVRIG